MGVSQFEWATGYVVQLLGGVLTEFDTGASGTIDADAPQVAIRVMRNCIKTGLVKTGGTGPVEGTAGSVGAGSSGTDVGSWIEYGFTARS